jgi:hypothetical protein
MGNICCTCWDEEISTDGEIYEHYANIDNSKIAYRRIEDGKFNT